ncbi:MAG TPA: 2-oxoglutarate dehydrogenase, E2 component, dihydrolipoamide succinyltransferase [Acidobacteriaceae bacterium]|nr:2-oxoglutarate dehydrogenase, E2 component, dihydrolipoamide succinyltransferase [Acidobacteriaceae bacterium]
MPTNVVMPQMGESIFEGTITKWLKKAGDTVQRDEPLFEISTDKVDAEIPAPASGVLTEIKVSEGATVEINTIVAVIGESDGAAASNSATTIDAAKMAKEGAVATAPEKAKEPAPPPATAPAPAPTSGGSADMSSGREVSSTAGSTGGTNIVMPQMGESIFEGTITKWLKKVGDTVQRDEPLFEISTDKVDAEIPAPAAGVLTEIKVPEGTTVEINTVVAVIGASAAGAGAPAAAATVEKQAAVQPSATPAAASAPSSAAPTEAGEHGRSSPLVRRIAKDNNLDLSKIRGTGAGGRITKEDALAYLSQQGKGSSTPAIASQAVTAAPTLSAAPSLTASAPAAVSIPGELVPLSKMRSIIAQRMVESKHTSAHVHSVFKIDMTRIVKIREREKSKYEQRNGVKLTYMPFIASAVVSCLRKMPIVNASLEGNAIRYHQNINIGIAVALDWGLIVPVIKQAEDRSFLGLARGIADLAARARAKKLKPDEVSGGTFTITNPGIFGEQFGTPVINQPETAILGVGGLFKEPTVVTDADGNDSIAVRHIMRLTLGFDHRVIDGADAGKFMAEMKKTLENWDGDIG